MASIAHLPVGVQEGVDLHSQMGGLRSTEPLVLSNRAPGSQPIAGARRREAQAAIAGWWDPIPPAARRRDPMRGSGIR